MRYFLYTLAGLAVFATAPISAWAATPSTISLAERLAGRIVLQVHSRGEAFYIDPVDRQRYFLGNASDAFALLTSKGLGIRHETLHAYLNTQFPPRLSGRILLDVESRGEAYYVHPFTLRATYFATPADAYALMREKGLGISNVDLEKIPTATVGVDSLELATLNKINEHRAALTLPALKWNQDIALIARAHSRAMANGTVAFSHDGFSARVEEIRKRMLLGYAGENIAMNLSDNPVRTAVDGWLASQGHLENIERRIYSTTGIGVAKDASGRTFFTQIFVEAK